VSEDRAVAAFEHAHPDHADYADKPAWRDYQREWMRRYERRYEEQVVGFDEMLGAALRAGAEASRGGLAAAGIVAVAILIGIPGMDVVDVCNAVARMSQDELRSTYSVVFSVWFFVAALFLVHPSFGADPNAWESPRDYEVQSGMKRWADGYWLAQAGVTPRPEVDMRI